jgi:multisubunit Na+/H+ antiporter MnhG subunit
MNLTAHIIRKDLVRFRWALLVWGLSFLYLFARPNLTLAGSPNLQDYFQLIAIITFAVLCVGLISGVVQEDPPADSSAQWRTRPISPLRMMGAKLLLLGVLFIVVPVVAVGVRHVFDRGHALHDASEYGLEGLVLAALVCSLAAAAACTKNVVHCMALWLGLIFATGTLAELLGRFSPVISRQMAMQLNTKVALTILGFSVLVGLAVVVNQYLKRRMSVSIGLLIGGSVGSALVGTAYSYFYFYSSQ